MENENAYAVVMNGTRGLLYHLRIVQNAAALIGIAKSGSKADLKNNKASPVLETPDRRKGATMKQTSQPPKPSLPQKNPLTGLKGGPKRLFINQHRDTILDCLSIFGEDWVKEQFRFNKRDKLGVIRHMPEKRPTMNKPDKVDYLEVKIEGIAEMARQNKRDIENMTALFNQFVESTSNQITKALVIPLLRNVLKFEGELPIKPNPLNVEKIVAQALKTNGSRYAKRKQIEGRCRITHE